MYDNMNSLQSDNTLSRGQYWRFVLFVIVLATVVTVWFTRPLLSQVTTSVPGRQGDAIEHLWTIWWFEEALTTRGQSPAELDILFYPSSINHPILSAGFWASTVSKNVLARSAGRLNFVLMLTTHICFCLTC